MRRYRIEKTEVLIIGAGMAGLRAAMEATSSGRKVLILSRGNNCSWGIGGFNAAVGCGDDAALYYADILKSGRGINDKTLARILAENSSKEVQFLQKLGMEFDQKEDGSFDLLQPLGCSVPRLVHRASSTGALAEKIFLGILQKRGAEVRKQVTIVDLLSDGERVYGAFGVENGELVSYQAGAVVLAAGGCGQMYPISTYPSGIQGDSYAMLFRAGAEMVDMEFMQFEPCCLIAPPELYGRGISTTMLSAGAVLRNAKGEEFISRYFTSLAEIQKGELSRAVYAEIQACKGEPVEYDMTGFTREEIDAHCIYSKRLRDNGYDLTSAPVQVMPAAHTFLGGAYVDRTCKTSLKGLYAAGEAMGGLHGANRIGGCAGAETFVFGAIAGTYAAEAVEISGQNNKETEILTEELLHRYFQTDRQEICKTEKLLEKLQDILIKHLFLIREEKGLVIASDFAEEALHLAERLPKDEPEQLLEAIHVENVALLTQLIAEISGLRKESRGVFFRKDYPKENNTEFGVSFVVKKDLDKIQVSKIGRL